MEVGRYCMLQDVMWCLGEMDCFTGELKVGRFVYEVRNIENLWL